MVLYKLPPTSPGDEIQEDLWKKKNMQNLSLNNSLSGA